MPRDASWCYPLDLKKSSNILKPHTSCTIKSLKWEGVRSWNKAPALILESLHAFIIMSMNAASLMTHRILDYISLYYELIISNPTTDQTQIIAMLMLHEAIFCTVYLILLPFDTSFLIRLLIIRRGISHWHLLLPPCPCYASCQIICSRHFLYLVQECLIQPIICMVRRNKGEL